MKINFCKKCVNNSLRPRLKFNKYGVCDACVHNENKKNINYDLRKKKLFKFLDKYRNKDGSHDCIVPSSGGKDSTYVAYKLKYEYGMNPLCVSWAPAIYTKVGIDNIINFSKKFDTQIYIPNREIHSKLTKIAFEKFGDPLQPWHYGVETLPIKIAAQNKIQLIFYGENQDVEYGGSRKMDHIFLDYTEKYAQQSFRVEKGVDTLIQLGVKMNLFTTDVLKKKNLFSDYRLPKLEFIKKHKIKPMYFSYFENWSPQANYFYVRKYCEFKTGNSRSSGTYTKYTSLDDKIDELYYYLQYLKFGFGRATSEACVDIRDGYITREEAVSLVKYYDGEYPNEDLQDVLKYLKLNKKSFDKICEKFRNTKIFKKKKNNFKLKITLQN